MIKESLKPAISLAMYNGLGLRLVLGNLFGARALSSLNNAQTGKIKNRVVSPFVSPGQLCLSEFQYVVKEIREICRCKQALHCFLYVAYYHIKHLEQSFFYS